MVEFTPVIQHGDSQRTVLEEWIDLVLQNPMNKVLMSKRLS